MKRGKQLRMITNGQDLPLFSGTPQTVRPKQSQGIGHTPPLPLGCPLCLGTGYVGKKPCICGLAKKEKA